MPDPGYHADVAEMAPGDVLICVTDGVTERTDGAGSSTTTTGWPG